MSITIHGEAVKTAHDALLFYYYRATMDCGLHGGGDGLGGGQGTPEAIEAEVRLAQAKYGLRSLLKGNIEAPESASFPADVAEIIKSALIWHIVQADLDIEFWPRWTPERGEAKKRSRLGRTALHALTWAISQSEGQP